MKLSDRLRAREKKLTVKKRLTYSNIIMFLVPVAVTVLTAFIALAVAFYAFSRFCLPRMGLSMRELHDMGEQYENDLKTFGMLLLVLALVMLALLILSIVLTNRFLTRFMYRRIEEPLWLVSDGMARIGAGNLESPVVYDREDEFRPVCDTVNLMAARLRESAEQSAAEEQSRKELFAGISHDLRSPLTSVRAYTEALLEGVAQTPEDEKRYLLKIHTHEFEIERMVEQLFLYTKMELKTYPVHMQTLNLRRELLRICNDNPMEHLQVINKDVPPFAVYADPFLLERIAVNLLGNSEKYRSGELATVRISAEKDGDGILLCFEDDGPGVSEELLPRLFDAFYRTDPARRNPAGGSGLGLAIVQQAVHHMNGSVWAENRESGGLRIRIRLQEGKENAENTDCGR